MSWTAATEAFAKHLPGYEERPEQTKLAQRIERALELRRHLLAQAGCGCIQGDAEIIVNRGGNSRRMTMRHLVVAFNGGRNPGQQKRWDPSIPTYVQREVEGTVRLGRVQDAWFSGVKTTYTVTTETGRTLRATDEHPFLTERGWLRLDELEVGDELHVRGEQTAGAPRQPKPRYARVCVLIHPYRNGKTVPKHRLVAEADINGMSYEDFLASVRAGEVNEWTFLDPEVWAVHHKDHDSTNNDLGNLQVMTHAEHHALHAAEGKTDSVLFKIVTEKIVTIEQFGEEKTYDIEVADDPHNFLVNGIVVHNTGKSFAYLIALIFRAKLTGMPSVVATATKALQAQLAEKDLPFLVSIFPWLRFAVVKGRSNYVCQAKIDEPRAAQEVPYLRAILDELAEGHNGDLDTLTTVVEPRHRQYLAVVGEECPGKRDCPFGQTCFAERAKAEAAGAHVVIANHSVLMFDTEVRRVSMGAAGMLPHYGALAVDEAHELESYATNALGTTFGERGLRTLADDVAGYLNDGMAAKGLISAAHVLFEIVTALIPERESTFPLGDALLVQIFPALDATRRAALTLLEQVKADRPPTEQKAIQQKRIVRRMDGMIGRLEKIMLAEDEEIVRWIERIESTFKGHKTTTVKLAFAPLHVGQYLREQIWSKTPTTLVSATLSTGAGGFDYIAGRLGFEEYDSFDAGSPFDFAEKARMYVPLPKVKGGSFPNDPRDDTWSTRMSMEVGELIKAAGGRTLLLFSSRRSMETTYEDLMPLLKRLKLTVLKQGDAPNGQLSERFADDETSVLFALKSFMVGADFQGDTLRLVVIDKMAFPVPTDVIFAARSAAIDARARSWSDKSFMSLAVPTMELTLAQAVGRLIRTTTDEGLFAIMDSRLLIKPYGAGVLRGLPPARRVTTLDAATAYLTELTARRSG